MGNKNDFEIIKRIYKQKFHENPARKLKIAIIYSYGANEGESDGIIDEECPEDTINLDQETVVYEDENTAILKY